MSNFVFNKKVNITNSTVGDHNDISNYLSSNSKIEFDQTDKELILAIHKYSPTIESKKDLLESLEKFKNENAATEVKNNFRRKILQFLKDITPTLGETAVKMLTAYYT